MSDARDVVQPRWKRRATEIAEAIGGGGSSSVTLDINSINAIKDAFKEALYGTSAEQLATFGAYVSNMGKVNQYSHPLSWEAAGHTLVNSVSGPNQGKFNDIPVTFPSNSTALPVIIKDIDHSSGLVNPSLGGTPALRVNLMNSNAIQTTVTGHVQVKSAIDPANSSNIIPMNVNIDRLPIYTNGNTKPVPIMSGSNFAGAVQELKVREQNLNGASGGIKITETTPVTSVSVGGTVNVGNHPTPVTTVSVDNHPTPVTTVSVDNHPTSTTITGIVPVDIQQINGTNVNGTSISVTETNPVSGGGGTTTGVQNVKIVGDETTGIIMTKIYPYGPNTSNGNFSSTEMYVGQSYGAHGVSTGLQTFNIQQSVQQLGPGYNPVGGDINTGWIIRSNGVDIYNQDITLGIVAHAGSNATPTTYANIIEITGQDVIDKYHGRKVTLSSVANVWIVEPDEQHEQVYNEGHIHWASGYPSTTNQWDIYTMGKLTGYNQRVRDIDGGLLQTSESSVLSGAKVVRHPDTTDLWTMVAYNRAR